MEDDNVKLFTFRVAGYVPGVPRDFPGGCQAYINVETLEVLAEGPIGQPLALPVVAAVETLTASTEARVTSVPDEVVAQPERVVDASTGFNFVASGSIGG